MVNYLVFHWGSHKAWAFKYVLCESLNLLNTVLQLLVTDSFLGGQFLGYGPRVVRYFRHGAEEDVDPMDQVTMATADRDPRADPAECFGGGQRTFGVKWRLRDKTVQKSQFFPCNAIIIMLKFPSFGENQIIVSEFFLGGGARGWSLWIACAATISWIWLMCL